MTESKVKGGKSMSEHNDDDERPIPPLTRDPGALLAGLIHCLGCGEKLVAILDANGQGYYVHESQLDEAQLTPDEASR